VGRHDIVDGLGRDPVVFERVQHVWGAVGGSRVDDRGATALDDEIDGGQTGTLIATVDADHAMVEINK
jgi:hypothetical protein